MRFIVENLGPVRHADMDVRPLMVIIGKNNVGKTWLAYTMAMAWKRAASGWRTSQALTGQGRSVMEWTEAIALDVKSAMKGLKEQLGVRMFQDGYKNFADTTCNFEIQREEIESALLEAVDGVNLEADRVMFKNMRQPARILKHVTHERQLMVVSALIRHLFSPLMVFPAERNAFVLTYRMLVNRRFMAMRDRIRYGGMDERKLRRQESLARELGEMRYPQPVEDFLDFLSEVETVQERRLKRSSTTAPIADLIEVAIHGGQRLEWVPTPLGGGAELAVTFGTDKKVDLYNAASSIKQLAPLVLYLRHMAPRRSFLIIDEPEMNLHPEAQARFVEVMALLVQAGHQVLLTTHSPYILAHLNNIIAGSSNPETRTKQANELYLGNPGAFLRPEQVGAWELDDEGLKPLYEEGWGIRYTTLSDPAEEISRRYYAIRAMDDDGDAA